MAFIFRSDRKSYGNTTTTENVGPNSYQSLGMKQVQQSCVPFGTSSERLKSKKEKDIMPGPGQYYNSNLNGLEKVVVSSANEDIKIVEVPRQSSNFKSQAKRFQEKKQDEVPGPGQYNPPVDFGQKKKKNYQQDVTEKKNILETLQKINQHKTIPSIPSKLHSFGYTEGKALDLKLNQFPQQIHTGVGKDKIGPGHYQNVNGFNSNKGTQWHKYQARNKEKTKSQTLGPSPGSYDVQTTFIPLYQMKQSAAFQSQTVRTLEQQKGKISQQLLKQKQQKEMQGIGQSMDQNEQIADYVQDSVPAPGHYHNEQVMSSIKIKQKEEKFQFFGSSADRFVPHKEDLEIGPGQYPVSNNQIGQPFHPIKVKNPPFLSSNTRFEVRSIVDQKPSAGQYENKVNTLEDKLIKKIQKGYRGNFGTSQKRFKDTKSVDIVPGPGTYINPIKEVDQEDVQPTYQFKSVQQRQIELKKSNIPPVGSYKLDQYDIKKKIEIQQEEDPELIVRKPGFQSSAPRFKENQQIYEQDTADDSMSQPPVTKKNPFMKQSKSVQGVGFNNKAKRFNYNQKEKKPGPGQYYNPGNAASEWNKRTYNILYAEI